MFGNYTNFLEKTLDFSVLQRNATANNITNYNTPNYKATKAQFDLMMDQSGLALKTTEAKHILSVDPSGQPQLVADTTTKERPDGNNVDLNVEMIGMMKNNTQYSEAIQAINQEFALLKTAIGK